MLKLLIFLPLLFTSGHLQTNKPSDLSKNILEINSFNQTSAYETCHYRIDELKLVLEDIDIQKYNIGSCAEMTKDMAMKEIKERSRGGGPQEYILEDDGNCENNDLRFALTLVSAFFSTFGSIFITRCCVRQYERTQFYNIIVNFFTDQRSPSSIAMNPASTRQMEEVRVLKASRLADNVAKRFNSEQQQTIRRLIRSYNS